MNWLLVIVIAIILFFAVRGWNRGLLRMLYSLISVVLLIVLISFATPHISQFIRENTGIHEAIRERCADMMQERLKEKSETYLESATAKEMSLPEQVTSYIIGTGETAIAETGVYETIGDKAADFILAGVSFLLTLLAAVIVVNVIGRMLNVVNRIPVIKGINRTLGIFAGMLEGYIIITILFLLLALVSGSAPGEACIKSVDGNPILEHFYYHNALLELFSDVFH